MNLEIENLKSNLQHYNNTIDYYYEKDSELVKKLYLFLLEKELLTTEKIERGRLGWGDMHRKEIEICRLNYRFRTYVKLKVETTYHANYTKMTQEIFILKMRLTPKILKKILLNKEKRDCKKLREMVAKKMRVVNKIKETSKKLHDLEEEKWIY